MKTMKAAPSSQEVHRSLCSEGIGTEEAGKFAIWQFGEAFGAAEGCHTAAADRSSAEDMACQRAPTA